MNSAYTLNKKGSEKFDSILSDPDKVIKDNTIIETGNVSVVK
jgi:hypothetical protein